ncbi:MarR family transcriptional regulator [Priestia aryabhattai]|uniref:MarR family transcriptional regulator n=1 Tax=Priestia aryabhattai TaxID=412384 RepID=UPI00203DFE16|nr:MarR family transcriptional regulator [Priestia aryabhattai]MCM3774290.1 MarR family transcriptional regulator [Priestia aryabhattai]
MKKNNILNFEQAEKNARLRDIDLERKQIEQLKGFSQDQVNQVLNMMKQVTGDDYFFGKKKKPSDKVRFTQMINENIEYLIKIRYITDSEQAFLFKVSAYLEFKTNVLIEKSLEGMDIQNSATPSYFAEQFGKTRENISRTMNSLLKKGILGVAEAGMTTEEGRTCSSRTWFVNPNIICCSPKDGVDKATQHIFKRSLRNFRVKDDKKKHNLPVYLF